MNEWVSEWLLQYSYPHKAPQFSLLSQQLMVSSTMKASALNDIFHSKQTFPHPSSYSLNVPSMSLGKLELEKIFSPLFRLHNVACGLRIVVYLTRDWTHAPCARSVEFNHWTTRETWLLFEDTAFHTFQENSGHCPLSEGNWVSSTPLMISSGPLFSRWIKPSSLWNHLLSLSRNLSFLVKPDLLPGFSPSLLGDAVAWNNVWYQTC